LQQVCSVAAPVPSTANSACNNSVIAKQNNFPERNRHILTFFHPNCTLEDHIVSTAGDALSGDAARHSCTLKAITFQLNFMLKVQILNTWLFQEPRRHLMDN
jgi:hypothetical protein